MYLFIEVNKGLVWELQRLNGLQHSVPVTIVDFSNKTLHTVHSVQCDSCLFLISIKDSFNNNIEIKIKKLCLFYNVQLPYLQCIQISALDGYSILGLFGCALIRGGYLFKNVRIYYTVHLFFTIFSNTFSISLFFHQQTKKKEHCSKFIFIYIFFLLFFGGRGAYLRLDTC